MAAINVFDRLAITAIQPYSHEPTANFPAAGVIIIPWLRYRVSAPVMHGNMLITFDGKPLFKNIQAALQTFGGQILPCKRSLHLRIHLAPNSAIPAIIA
ncbi:MAG: hypothetical protein Q4G22_07125 [Paracoccus sp. (in: a-proteobacteria)]|nr:hypothetical protein [Paracoccus sp. (in: a-proteobacteria)]